MQSVGDGDFGGKIFRLGTTHSAIPNSEIL
jgi:hypothetical protein